MKHTSVLRALQKHGVAIQQGQGLHDNQFWVRAKDHIISWIKQGEKALCLHVRHEDDRPERQSDYVGGSYVRTLRHALALAGLTR